MNENFYKFRAPDPRCRKRRRKSWRVNVYLRWGPSINMKNERRWGTRWGRFVLLPWVGASFQSAFQSPVGATVAGFPSLFFFFLFHLPTTPQGERLQPSNGQQSSNRTKSVTTSLALVWATWPLNWNLLVGDFHWNRLVASMAMACVHVVLRTWLWMKFPEKIWSVRRAIVAETRVNVATSAITVIGCSAIFRVFFHPSSCCVPVVTTRVGATNSGRRVNVPQFFFLPFGAVEEPRPCVGLHLFPLPLGSTFIRLTERGRKEQPLCFYFS